MIFFSFIDFLSSSNFPFTKLYTYLCIIVKWLCKYLNTFWVSEIIKIGTYYRSLYYWKREIHLFFWYLMNKERIEEKSEVILDYVINIHLYLYIFFLIIFATVIFYIKYSNFIWLHRHVTNISEIKLIQNTQIKISIHTPDI